MHPAPTPLAHRSSAFGLTRFACQKTRFHLPTEQPAAGARPPNGGQGAQPWGTGGGTPHAVERYRRGRDAWGESEPQSGYTSLFGPPAGGLVLVFLAQRANDFA